MSQNPPASGGWIDPYGTAQAGFPPPGYWQASDGRWYPPESRPAEPFAPPGEMTVAAGPQAPGPSFGASPAEPPGIAGGPSFGAPVGGPSFGAPSFGGPPPAGPSSGPGPFVPGQFAAPGPVPPARSQKKSRAGLWAVLGVLLVAFGGCGALGVYVYGRVDDTIEQVSDELSTLPLTTSTVVGDTTTIVGSEDVGTIFGRVEDGLADVAGCTRLDSDRIEIDLTNSSGSSADYWLTVVLEDQPGQRLADTTAFVEDLRPGERAVEQSYIFEAEGANCEIIAADRYPVETDPAAQADVGACAVGEADSFGDVVAELTVVNSASANSDYSITVAIIDGDNVRRGSGFAYIETVRPGESAPGEVFTTIEYADGYRCEIVAVERSAS